MGEERYRSLCPFIISYLLDSPYDIVICGGVNGRIGNLNDEVAPLEDVVQRRIIGPVINQHGRSLIEFLHEAAMCMVNGRVEKGEDGYTFVAGRGKSVVDYIMVTHDNA